MSGSGEGVDFNYVGDVDPNLICSICYSVFQEPVTSSACKHTFCRGCIEQCITAARHPKCPIDRSVISLDVLVDAGAAFRNILDDVKVQCTAPGCGATFERSLVTSHKASCRETVLECLNEGCQKSMPRKEMIPHLTEKCVGRKYMCSVCSKPVTVHNYQEHQHLSQPGKGMVDCSFCKRAFPRHDMIAHRWTCTKAIVSCPHARHGCPITMERSVLGAHIDLCPYERLSEFINQTKRRMNDLEQGLRNVDNTCRTEFVQLAQDRLDNGSRFRGLDEMVLPMWRLIGVPAHNNEYLRSAVDTHTNIPLDGITRMARFATNGPFGDLNGRINEVDRTPITARRRPLDETAPRYHGSQGQLNPRGPRLEESRSRTNTEIGARDDLIEPPLRGPDSPTLAQRSFVDLTALQPRARRPVAVVGIPRSMLRQVPATPVVVPLSPASPSDSGEPTPSDDDATTPELHSDGVDSGNVPPLTPVQSARGTEHELRARDCPLAEPAPAEADVVVQADVDEAQTSASSGQGPDHTPLSASLPELSRRLRASMQLHTLEDDQATDQDEEVRPRHSRRPRVVGNQNVQDGQVSASLTTENLHVHEAHTGATNTPPDTQQHQSEQQQHAPRVQGDGRYSRRRHRLPGESNFADLAFERLGYPTMPAFPSEPEELDDQLSDLRGVVHRLAEGMDTMERQNEARNITENLRLQEEVNSLRAIVHVMRNQVMMGHQGQFARPPTQTPSSPTASDSTVPDTAIRESIAFSSQHADVDGPSETSSVSSLITANNPVQRPRGSMWGRGLGQPMGIPPELDDGAPTIRVQVTRPITRLEGSQRTTRSRTSVLNRLNIRNRSSRPAP